MVNKPAQYSAFVFFIALLWLLIGFFLGSLAGFEFAPSNEPCNQQKAYMVCEIEPSDICGYWGCYELGDCSTNSQEEEQ